MIFSQFVFEPGNPEVGESIFLKCRLNAPAGHKFIATTPELKVNASTPFTCERLSDETGNLRFRGMHYPDVHLTNLSCDIVIFFLEESDLGNTFTCFQELDDYTTVGYDITLARYSTYSTYQTTSLGTSTLATTTLASRTRKSSVTPDSTDSTPIGMGIREMMITSIVLVCSILLCLCCMVFTPFFSFLCFGFYLLLRNFSSRSTQYSVDPIPKSKKEAIDEQLQYSSLELQALFPPERGQEENPETDCSPLEPPTP